MARTNVPVNDQQSNASFVASSVAMYREPVTAGLLALNAELPPEDHLEADVAERFLTWLGKILERKNKALIAAETACVAEQVDDVPRRGERDEKHEGLASHRIRGRDRVEPHFGGDSLSGYGLNLRTPRSLPDLLAYARTGAELLRKDPRTVDDGMGGQVSTVALADSIDAMHRQAADTVHALVRERRELDASRIVRNLAQDDLVEMYQIVAGLLIYVFRLAGHPELAERIRPALRRPPRTGNDGDSDGAPDSAEAQPDESVTSPAK